MGRKPLHDNLKMGDGEDSQTDEERRVRKKRKIVDESDDDDSLTRDDDDDDQSVKSNKNEKSPFQMCLDHLNNLLQRKDVNGFFSFPVTDTIAPGYSNVIEKGMDFSTMSKKIENDLYHSVKEYKDDYELMMNNCMLYNREDTVYHKEAKRLLVLGGKYLSKERLTQMKRNFQWMSALTPDQIDLEDAPIPAQSNNFPSDTTNKLQSDFPEGSNSRFEAIADNLEPEEVLLQVQSAAKAAADKLKTKSPKSNMGYLSKGPDGTTTLNFLNPSQEGSKVVDLGGLVGRLVTGSDELTKPKEDSRNKITPVQYLQYGAFNSFGPVYDSSKANITKAQSDLLLSTYAGETGLQYAKSLQEFVKGSGDYVVTMVDDLLDLLTNGQHSITNAAILQQEKELMTKDKCSEDEEKEDGGDDNDEVLMNESTESRELDEALDKTSRLLLSLEKVQQERLSRVPPQNNKNQEIGLAHQITSELTQLIKSVKPEDLVEVEELRNAMNVTPDLAQVSLPLSVTPDSLLKQHNALQQIQKNQLALQQQQNNVATNVYQQQQNSTPQQQIIVPISQLQSTSMQQVFATNVITNLQPQMINTQQPIIVQPQQLGQHLKQQTINQPIDLNQLLQQQRLIQQQQQQVNNLRANTALIQALQQQQIQQLQQHQQTQQLNQIIKIQSNSPQPQIQIQPQLQPRFQQQPQQQIIKQNIFLSQPFFVNQGSPITQQTTTS